MSTFENRAKPKNGIDLNHIITDSYSLWAKTMAFTVTGSIAADYLIRQRVPRYAAIGAARRFYGWTLFCLGVSQFSLEDNELGMMASHNSNTVEDDFKKAEEEAQRRFLADLEKRKVDAKN